MDINNTNERLTELLKYDVRTILGNSDLKEEYVALHIILEGFRPACTGCSAKSSLRKWKSKYLKVNSKVRIAKKKEKMAENTFILKKGVTSLRIPFTSKVITKDSKDELVTFYIEQAKTDSEKERRIAFFEVLPTVKEEIIEEKPKKKRKRRTKAEIEADKTSIEEIQFKEVE